MAKIDKVKIQNYIMAKNTTQELLHILSHLGSDKVKEILVEIFMAYCYKCGRGMDRCICGFVSDDGPKQLENK